MLNGNTIMSGQVVRLTTPYLNAERGLYTVVYVYSNGWLGVVSHHDGQGYDVPPFVCRPIEEKSS